MQIPYTVKRWIGNVNVLITIIIVFFSLAIVNFIAQRHYARFDLTKSHLYSLSDKTIAVLNGLTQDLKVVVFFEPENMLYGKIKQLLKEYASRGQKLQIEYLDPQKDLARARFLAEQYKISEANVIILDCAGKHKYIAASEMGDFDYAGGYPQMGGGTPVLKAFKGEEAITAAILSITQEKVETVYFAEGHGERSLDDFTEEGIAQLKQKIEQQNLKVKSLTLMNCTEMPNDCAVLVIAGPQKRLLDQEIALLEAYIGKGGRVAFLLDPTEEDTGLESFLKKYGVDVKRDIVVDPKVRLPFLSAANLMIVDYPMHAITKSMREAATVYLLARSISPLKQEIPGLSVQTVSQTSSDGWGEVTLNNPEFRFDKDSDTQGPVSVAVAVSQSSKDAGSSAVRLFVCGDADFITNTQFALLANADMFMNALNWLLEREQLISITPKAPENVKLHVTARGIRIIWIINIAVIPLFIIGLGVGIWYKRRS